MGRLYLAELRDSWPAWLGVCLAFVITNLSYANSALVLASGWDAVGSGRLALMNSTEYTIVPVTNLVFSGLVGLVVIGTSAGMVVDARRGALARLALAGGTPRQVVGSVMLQLLAVCLASALIADVVAVATLGPWLEFLATGLDTGEEVVRVAPTAGVWVVLLANVGVVAVALLGGYRQARRAAAIPPVEALRQAAAPMPPRMGVGGWIGAAACVLVLGASFAMIVPLTAARDKETASSLLQAAVGALILSMMIVALLAPLLIGPLARAWTALIPSRAAVWQLARTNISVRGPRFARSVTPIIFTIGLMLGFLSIAPTIAATAEASGLGPMPLDKAGMGAFLSLLGPALAVALAGGVGNLFMMSKQRDAELALLGISGATPGQRTWLPALEALVLVVTAAIPALASVGVMFAYLLASFTMLGMITVFGIPAVAWLVSLGATALIMVAATVLPTLAASRLPEPRVIARLAAE